MPALFVGHGSPMNIIENNAYTRSLAELGRKLPRPEAVIVISAHWLTSGTYITAAQSPETIYDFYGFPEELYQAAYACPGSPEAAALVQEAAGRQIKPDARRGIDHAGWAVLKHMYPQGDIPVLEISLDVNKSPQGHYALGQALQSLRHQGILLVGSGNIVHNLARSNFSQLYGYVHPWAEEFDRQIAELLLARDHDRLINYQTIPHAGLAVPTDDHYLPMLYTIALQEENEALAFTCTDMQNASIAMRGFLIGVDGDSAG
ncbi:4,5-DOPA dioxygenase extradiol|nr:4,5-DOPA dioxygenase extradiol [Dendrosporobacter quercicolus DSM 1736]